MTNIFTLNHNGIVVASAVTLMQYKAGAANKASLVRCSISQGLSETSTMEQIQVLRNTSAATVTSFTLLENDPDGPIAFGVGGTAATGITATAEGGVGDILINEAFNILNGFLWVRGTRQPDEIIVPAGGLIAMRFPVAPASATWRAQMVLEEY